jgi:hypothetical protein
MFLLIQEMWQNWDLGYFTHHIYKYIGVWTKATVVKAIA